MSITNKSLGNIEFKNGNYEKALEFYNNSLEEESGEQYYVYSNIASTFVKLNNNKAALEYIIKSIKHNPDWDKSWIKLGEILVKNSKYDKAIDAYTRAIELNSDNSKNISVRIKELRELINNTDTESEDENPEPIYTNNKSQDLPNINPADIGINTPTMFGKMMKNKKIMEKMQSLEFQKKVMDNKSNPFIIFKDPELMEVMQEMYKEFKS